MVDIDKIIFTRVILSGGYFMKMCGIGMCRSALVGEKMKQEKIRKKTT